jgi:hypothetical protein
VLICTIAAFTTIKGLMNLIPGNFEIRKAIIIAISSMSGIEINEGDINREVTRKLRLELTTNPTPPSGGPTG